MINFKDTINQLLSTGFREDNVEEKLSQDIIIKALAECGLKENLTIKGGVVMSNITNDIRRTTLDIDIDFIKFSLSDATIRDLVERMNCIEGISISIIGDIVELKQHDYHGKRVFLSLQDKYGNVIETKMDIGVHTIPEAQQVEIPFQMISINYETVTLFANTNEQIFVEKLKSLLRLGAISNRAKDVDDMIFLSERINRKDLLALIKVYIYNDTRMLEKNIDEIISRVSKVFSDKNYLARLSHRRSNWLEIEPQEATKRLLEFLRSLK